MVDYYDPYAATADGARRLLANALQHVESASIRAWVVTDHNRPLWEAEALARIQAGRTDDLSLSTSIVCLAIGL